MINHFNFDMFRDKVLLTNDLGEYAFLNREDFAKLVTGKLGKEDDSYALLAKRHFITDKSIPEFVEELTRKLRSIKDYVFWPTALHIFALTNMCNMRCIYCQAKAPRSTKQGAMSRETGLKAIEIAMQSPAKNLTLEFQGGEPLLNFDVFKAMIIRAIELNKEYKKELTLTIVTNLINLDEDKLKFLMDYHISLCTSLDGNEFVHNNNRPLRSGEPSYSIVISRIKQLRNKGVEVGAIETTTRKSLAFPKEIVDAYLNTGINSIFLRALSPLGLASANWGEIGYAPDEFLAFYKKALQYIIEINKAGRYFPEVTASFFLKKILTGESDNYMELRSPCGASIGQMSYYYNGDVFTCDEGRMVYEAGDASFRLGNVYDNSYDEMMNSTTCKALSTASVIESLPSCCDCVYQPYCGVCPVVTYATSHDIFPSEPNDYRCQIYKGILDIVFGYLYEGNPEIIDVFYSWVR